MIDLMGCFFIDLFYYNYNQMIANIFKQYGRLIKQIARPSNLLRYPTFGFTTAKIYDLYTNKTHFNNRINSSSYKFKNQQIMLYCYFTQPLVRLVQTEINNKEKTVVIDDNNILILTFIRSTTQEMSDSAWQQRKAIELNFKQLMKIIKPRPKTQTTREISQIKDVFIEQQNKETKSKKTLIISDVSAERQVHFYLKEEYLDSQNEVMNIKWDLKYTFLYEEYDAFLQALKKNIIFVSGSAVSIQISKLNTLYNPTIKKQSPKKQQKVEKQKKLKAVSKKSKKE